MKVDIELQVYGNIMVPRLTCGRRKSIEGKPNSLEGYITTSILHDGDPTSRRVDDAAGGVVRDTDGRDLEPAVGAAPDRAPLPPEADAAKGDSTSLQRECSARARSRKSIHASRSFREMIARPKISRNEWKMAEI